MLSKILKTKSNRSLGMSSKVLGLLLASATAVASFCHPHRQKTLFASAGWEEDFVQDGWTKDENYTGWYSITDKDGRHWLGIGDNDTNTKTYYLRTPGSQEYTLYEPPSVIQDEHSTAASGSEQEPQATPKNIIKVRKYPRETGEAQYYYDDQRKIYYYGEQEGWLEFDTANNAWCCCTDHITCDDNTDNTDPQTAPQADLLQDDITQDKVTDTQQKDSSDATDAQSPGPCSDQAVKNQNKTTNTEGHMYLLPDGTYYKLYYAETCGYYYEATEGNRICIKDITDTSEGKVVYTTDKVRKDEHKLWQKECIEGKDHRVCYYQTHEDDETCLCREVYLTEENEKNKPHKHEYLVGEKWAFWYIYEPYGDVKYLLPDKTECQLYYCRKYTDRDYSYCYKTKDGSFNTIDDIRDSSRGQVVYNNEEDALKDVHVLWQKDSNRKIIIHYRKHDDKSLLTKPYGEKREYRVRTCPDATTLSSWLRKIKEHIVENGLFYAHKEMLYVYGLFSVKANDVELKCRDITRLENCVNSGACKSIVANFGLRLLLAKLQQK